MAMNGSDQTERLRVVSVDLFERDVKLRLPFRFGVVTLTEAPQAFVRVRIRTDAGEEATGMSAELMVPKWFDKSPELTNEQNFDQLRTALQLARQAYLAAESSTAFGLSVGNYHAHLKTAGERGLNPLAANFGPALLDKAILDALCRIKGVSFFDAIRINLPGIETASLTPDLVGFPMSDFLASLKPADSLNLRHTVGMVDPLTASDQTQRVGDGLPETLEEVIRDYGVRYFKLKLSGEAHADLDRLGAIAAILDSRLDEYAITLDGNEQFQSEQSVISLLDQIETRSNLARLRAAMLFIEQPIHRSVALAHDVSALSARIPVIIDESDCEIGSFIQARSMGYDGVSTKCCKGLYRSFLNMARCRSWNAAEDHERYFMSAEDLTCQAGLAVQQDLALVAQLGITHVERNGHHYVNGMAGAPAEEHGAFLKAHPDLYREQGGRTSLAINDGRVRIGSLGCPGFGSAAEPDWQAMREMTISLQK
jgi:hypothetical protein